MGLLGRLWATEEAPVKNATEKIVLTEIANTAFEGVNAEINFPILMREAIVDEEGLRATLNELARRGLIKDIEPLDEGVPSYLCKLGDGSIDEAHS